MSISVMLSRDEAIQWIQGMCDIPWSDAIGIVDAMADGRVMVPIESHVATMRRVDERFKVTHHTSPSPRPVIVTRDGVMTYA